MTDRQAQETQRMTAERLRAATEAAQRQAAADRARLAEFYARERAAAGVAAPEV